MPSGLYEDTPRATSTVLRLANVCSRPYSWRETLTPRRTYRYRTRQEPIGIEVTSEFSSRPGAPACGFKLIPWSALRQSVLPLSLFPLDLSSLDRPPPPSPSRPPAMSDPSPSAPSVPLPNRRGSDALNTNKPPVWSINESAGSQPAPLPAKCDRHEPTRSGVCCKELRGDDERTLIDPDVVRDV